MEKWICKKCAWWAPAPPNANLVALICPDCGNDDFFYSVGETPDFSRCNCGAGPFGIHSRRCELTQIK